MYIFKFIKLNLKNEMTLYLKTKRDNFFLKKKKKNINIYISLGEAFSQQMGSGF